MEPALGVLGRARRVRILVVLAKEALRSDEELAIGAEAQLDPAHRGADGIGPHLAVGLDAHEDRGFSRAVELLEVDADRAVELEEIGADRLAGGIAHAYAAHTEHVA